MWMPWIIALLGTFCFWGCLTECGSTRLSLVSSAEEKHDVLPTDVRRTQAAGVTTCAPGHEWRDGACAPCWKGSFSRKGGSCTRCSIPYTTLSTGATSADACNNCAPGFANTGWQLRLSTVGGVPSCVCAVCARGTFSGGGSFPVSCTPCPEGFTTPDNYPYKWGFTSRDNCTVILRQQSSTNSTSSSPLTQPALTPPLIPVCAAGQQLVQEGPGNFKCRPCRQGTFNPFPSNHTSYTGCKQCSMHFRTAGEEATSASDCRLCVPGRGRPFSKPSCECGPCAKGFYSGGGKPRFCRKCPTGTSTLTSGSTSSEQCTVLLGLAEQQKQALLDARTELNGVTIWDSNALNWNVNAPLCKFRGITCDGRGLVGSISLTGIQARGRLPRAFARLKDSLKHIEMSCFTADYVLADTSWPEEWSTLEKLEYLQVSECQLTGMLPVLGLPRDLKVLKLAANNFSGTLPAEYPALLPGLTELSLHLNKLQGELPAEWGAMAQLQVLQVSHNALQGPLPVAYGALRSLKWFDISQNSITGTIPEAYSGMLGMEWFVTGANRLTGQIPESLSAMSNLSLFDATNCQLEGTVPSTWWGSMPLLKMFNVNYNNLTGSLPAAMSAWLPDWERISKNNLIRGVRFQFSAEHNQLTGTIPSSFSQWRPLEDRYSLLSSEIVLSLSHNRLAGLLPPAPVAGFTHVLLDHNDFMGNLDELSGWVAWKDIRELNLASNEFQGPPPAAWRAWDPFSDLGEVTPRPQFSLNLGHNNLLSLPAEWANWTALSSLYVQDSNLDCQFPNAWRKMTFLQALSVNDNPGLTGCIPQEFLEKRDCGHDSCTALYMIETKEGEINPDWASLSDLLTTPAADFPPLHNTSLTGLCR